MNARTRERDARRAELRLRLPSLRELKRNHIRAVLARCNGNKSDAAYVLGINRRTLYRMLERWGVAS